MLTNMRFLRIENAYLLVRFNRVICNKIKYPQHLIHGYKSSNSKAPKQAVSAMFCC